ncbi:MAG: hypothetical protein ACXWP4_07840 [Polyangiales bacterium]
MKRAGACVLALGALLSAPRASAQEPPSYLPWWLRGDGVLAIERSTRPSRFEGPGGSVRYRSKSSFAWEASFAYLRGIDDAKAMAIPTSLRAIFIDSRGSRPDWDFHLAIGPTFEWSTEKTRLGGEIAFGIDRRIDPVFNRFLVELAFDQRHALEGHDPWTPAVMLRIGIATTFGFRHYQ